MRTARNGLLTDAAGPVVSFPLWRLGLPLLVCFFAALIVILAAGHAYADVDYPGKEADDAAALAAKEKSTAPAGTPVYIVGGGSVPLQVLPATAPAAAAEPDHQALDHVMERAATWRDSTSSNHPGAFPARPSAK